MMLDLSQLSVRELEALRDGARSELAKRQLPPLSAEELAFLPLHVIDAIKHYRERVGCGLRDAKDAVDQARRVLNGEAL